MDQRGACGIQKILQFLRRVHTSRVHTTSPASREFGGNTASSRRRGGMWEPMCVCVCVVPKRHMLLCYDAMLSLSRTRRSATGPAKAKVPLSLIRSHPKTVPKPGLSRCFGFPPLRFRMATCAPWSSRSHGPLGTVGRLDRGGGRNRCSSKAGREKLGGSNSWGSSSS